MIEHNTVYDLARNAGAEWLAEFHFDAGGLTECNGIWAIAETAENVADACARIEALQHGTLPPGIRAPYDHTTEKLAELFADWMESVLQAVDKIAESN